MPSSFEDFIRSGQLHQLGSLGAIPPDVAGVPIGKTLGGGLADVLYGGKPPFGIAPSWG